MYDAMDIAEYVLDYCENTLKETITILQLQKLLYYIQGGFISKTGSIIFDNKIEAWQYGPVIPDVYYWFNKFISEPIINVKSSVKLDKNEEKIIKEIVSDKIKIDAWKLVSQVHEELPWKRNYSPNSKFEITVEDLKEFFKKEN